MNEDWLSSLLPSPSLPTPNDDICVSGCTDVYENHNNNHLTSLTLVGGSIRVICPHVQKPFFDSLQKFKNLKVLYISHCGGISSDWLCLIPQNVIDLSIQYRSSAPTANQLSTLPTCIKYVSLQFGDENDFECDWTDEILQSLPRSLHRFEIDASDFLNLTQRMHEYLPPNLQDSSLYYNAEDTINYFISPLDRLYGSNASTH